MPLNRPEHNIALIILQVCSYWLVLKARYRICHFDSAGKDFLLLFICAVKWYLLISLVIKQYILEKRYIFVYRERLVKELWAFFFFKNNEINVELDSSKMDYTPILLKSLVWTVLKELYLKLCIKFPSRELYS